MVWRRLRIAADTSLAALHFIFQIVQGWGDDHLHQFHIYGKDYGISYEGGIGFVDNRGLTLSGTKTHVKQRFLPLTPLLMVSDVLWSPVLPA